MTTSDILSFAQLPLAPAIHRAVDELGFETPTPIQAESIPPLLAGRDLLGQAQTGTGKTAAFALPLLSQLDVEKKYPQLLVLAPTRELALQVAEAIQSFARHLPGFQVLPLYGGQNMSQQLRRLQRGVQVIVGTPGRIQDHLNRGTLKLDRLLAVVVDEADEMLKMGFIDAVEQILQHAPKERQVALFSATMPPAVRKIAHRHLKNPVEISIKRTTASMAAINQQFWAVKGLHKLDALTRLLEAEEFEAMLVFVRTKVATVELAEKLEARGFAAAALNGDMTQQMREKTVEQVKSGALDIVVATDVAARGLDVERITHVINYDVPYDTESYIHRIGRTGRAGRQGKAIIFVTPRERRLLAAIEQATGQNIAPIRLPTRQDITDRRISQFKEKINEVMAEQDLEFFEELIDDYQQEYDVAPRRIAAALGWLLQQERPLQAPAEPERQTTERDEDFAAPGGFRQRERAPRDDDRGRKRAGDPGQWRRYRIEVGRQHGVEPGNIVGAITNEANLSSRDIGAIKIYDFFSLVDLPPDLPLPVVRHLEKVWVRSRQLQLRPDGEPLPEGVGAKAGPGGRPGKPLKPRTGVRRYPHPTRTEHRKGKRR
ncbi:DEAD/DEAH box helicase [Desulfurivibrio dismutans]|uniref:DEAD/DEAH box helicase n=1 Tax=Desulfurivibrio dismutans TaxID=1398908 RepID=UPI0023DB84C0|nr:DEAD/DEAH box helicase [Desulfurivibrio alkaliphilus]MDF1613497.1 DEAD/DEAH box helicase [Desulfurivibrio alkaliphilus]